LIVSPVQGLIPVPRFTVPLSGAAFLQAPLCLTRRQVEIGLELVGAALADVRATDEAGV